MHWPEEESEKSFSCLTEKDQTCPSRGVEWRVAGVASFHVMGGSRHDYIGSPGRIGGLPPHFQPRSHEEGRQPGGTGLPSQRRPAGRIAEASAAERAGF